MPPVGSQGARRLPWSASPRRGASHPTIGNPPTLDIPRHGAAGPRASGPQPHQQSWRTEPMRRGMGNAPRPAARGHAVYPGAPPPHHGAAPPAMGQPGPGRAVVGLINSRAERNQYGGEWGMPPVGSKGARLPWSASPRRWASHPTIGNPPAMDIPPHWTSPAMGQPGPGRVVLSLINSRGEQNQCGGEWGIPHDRHGGHAVYPGAPHPHHGASPRMGQPGPGRLVAGMGHAPGREHAPTLEPLIQLEIDHYGVTSYLSGSPRYR
ncbi:hypothetical protein J2Z79_001631 [Symbiobacterium terraclitae]|uniref:Uncharacterized protein n=1 Tax=Symbiobacterium terraclitae TaxID=557451 RepID=A0ABS4JRS3_9FIRM|nr:hypothetical protein [Symbiobacterium terraclitae]